MLHIRFATYQFLFKHRFILGCLAITWITVTISVYLISLKKQTKLEVQKAIHPTIYEEADHVQPASNYKMAEAISYCNPPNSIKRGDEGKPPVNASLEFVAVMFRHGDRAPLQQIRNLTNINCGTKHSPLLKNYLNVLKYLQGSIEHLPYFQTFPLHPDLKECSLQQMTLLGAHQHLMVGQALKKSYIDEHSLLTMNWTSSDIKVYSSIYCRTFQSALAFLFGFLPHFNISNINISPIPDIRFCMSEYYCNCHLLDQLDDLQAMKKTLFLLEDSATLNTIQELVPIIKQHPDQSLSPDPFFMLDALMGYVCHAAPMPCIPGTNECASFEHLHSLIAHLNWVEQEIQENSTVRNVAAMKTQGFLNHLIYKIDNYINGTDPVRFILYSAHDLTIQPLLSVFGIHNGGLVPYASHIAFEVYRTLVDNEVEYALRIVYKGIDATKDVSFCKSYFKPSERLLNDSKYDFCPLESFKKFVTGLVPSMGFPSFKALCNSHLNVSIMPIN